MLYFFESSALPALLQAEGYAQLVHNLMWIMWITLWRMPKPRDFLVDMVGDKMNQKEFRGL